MNILFSFGKVRSHGAVIFDGVGDLLLLKENRECLQGRPKLTKGARSATNIYAYTYLDNKVGRIVKGCP